MEMAKKWTPRGFVCGTMLSHLILQPGHFCLLLLQYLYWAQGCSFLGWLQDLFLY